MDPMEDSKCRPLILEREENKPKTILLFPTVDG